MINRELGQSILSRTSRGDVSASTQNNKFRDCLNFAILQCKRSGFFLHFPELTPTVVSITISHDTDVEQPLPRFLIYIGA